MFYGNPIVALLKDRRDSSLKAMRNLGLCVGVETLEGVLGARRGWKEGLSAGRTCLCNFASADCCCLHELGSEHGTLWWVDGRCGAYREVDWFRSRMELYDVEEEGRAFGRDEICD